MSSDTREQIAGALTGTSQRVRVSLLPYVTHLPSDDGAVACYFPSIIAVLLPISCLPQRTVQNVRHLPHDIQP